MESSPLSPTGIDAVGFGTGFGTAPGHAAPSNPGLGIGCPGNPGVPGLGIGCPGNPGVPGLGLGCLGPVPGLMGLLLLGCVGRTGKPAAPLVAYAGVISGNFVVGSGCTERKKMMIKKKIKT